MCSEIDIAFDFRTDTPRNRNTGEIKDPDTFSDTLRRYHKLLWSKPLPNGANFELEFTSASRPYYLSWSEDEKHILSSDAVVASFTRSTNQKIAPVIEEIPVAELDAFNTLGYTIGGMMVWPARRIDNKMTINGARGFLARIIDRFDLTVECVRRYYDNPSELKKSYNPLGETFLRYSYFFDLFRDFRGFVDFFLLQDLVIDDYSAVKFHTPARTPSEEFEPYPFPESKKAYREYVQNASEFINARNKRILAAIGRS